MLDSSENRVQLDIVSDTALRPGDYTFRAEFFSITGQEDFTRSFPGALPGDTGKVKVSFEPSERSTAAPLVELVSDSENGCIEPEREAEGGSCGTEGELNESLEFSAFLDLDSDLERDTGEPLVDDARKGEIFLYPNGTAFEAAANTSYSAVFNWSFARDAGNEVQTDNAEFRYSVLLGSVEGGAGTDDGEGGGSGRDGGGSDDDNPESDGPETVSDGVDGEFDGPVLDRGNASESSSESGGFGATPGSEDSDEGSGQSGNTTSRGETEVPDGNSTDNGTEAETGSPGELATGEFFASEAGAVSAGLLVLVMLLVAARYRHGVAERARSLIQ
jgi:hypothetical protein